MKRFNLSAWAVSHPALMLFLILALGAAGIFSYLQPRARRRPELHHQGRDRHDDLARRHRAGNAGPGCRPDREEAAGAAVLRQGHDLHQAVLHGDAGRRSRTTRRPGKCRSSSTSCARSSTTFGRPARRA